MNEHPNSITAKTRAAQKAANDTGRAMYLYERFDGKGYGYRSFEAQDCQGTGVIIEPQEEAGEDDTNPLTGELIGD